MEQNQNEYNTWDDIAGGGEKKNAHKTMDQNCERNDCHAPSDEYKNDNNKYKTPSEQQMRAKAKLLAT